MGSAGGTVTWQMNTNFLQRIYIRAVTGLHFAVNIINIPVVWMTDIMVGTSEQAADKSSVWHLEKAAEEDHVLVIVIVIVRVIVMTDQSPSQSRLQAVWRMSATSSNDTGLTPDGQVCVQVCVVEAPGTGSLSEVIRETRTTCVVDDCRWVRRKHKVKVNHKVLMVTWRGAGSRAQLSHTKAFLKMSLLPSEDDTPT
ncbi:hypothetical protein C0Q70_13832 [Pomacea canaliculata]|uniref:Uncharacterized protein n=1 Tax=Pomacea canaliculata TaxID=400727 RepID=A0A2T7NYF3_POMCA|nr:hypothetical protein C0Q70_13832 [Pomacea canaliculata]